MIRGRVGKLGGERGEGRRGMKEEKEKNIEKKGRTERMKKGRIYWKLKDNCMGV